MANTNHRPPLYRKAMKRYTIYLDPETVTHFKKYGAGSLAAGIRSEWREMKSDEHEAQEVAHDIQDNRYMSQGG